MGGCQAGCCRCDWGLSMKCVEYNAAGQTWHLCMNGAALMDAYEHFGEDKPVLEHITGTGKKAYSATCWLLAKLAEQGELVRRYQGFDSGKFPSETMFKTMLSPRDIPLAKIAIRKAVELGFRMSQEPEDGIDLGLQELEATQKKTKLDAGRDISSL